MKEFVCGDTVEEDRKHHIRMNATVMGSFAERFERNVSSEGKDRISSLPDRILTHVLSFLPTKYAFRTSVLSKRWPRSWISIPVVELDFSSLQTFTAYEDCYKKFVEKLLVLHDDDNIEKFRLSIRRVDGPTLEWWIWVLLTHRLQELNLDIFQIEGEDLLLQFSQFLIRSASLERLIMKMKCSLQLPTSVCLVSLKVLEVHSVTFSCEDLTEQVSLDFPNLQEFYIGESDWTNIKKFIVCAPMLAKLIISDPRKQVPNLSDCQIEVYAQALVSLRIATHLSYQYSVSNLSSISDAYVNIYDCLALFTSEDKLAKIFMSISNVMDLETTGETLTGLTKVDYSDPWTIPYLTNLKVSGEVLMNVVDLMNLLNMMPNLETLLFTGGLSLYIDDDDDDEYGDDDDDDEDVVDDDDDPLATIPNCPLPKLKSIELLNFGGDEKDFYVVNVFLRNAVVLETMTIYSSFRGQRYHKKNLEIATELLKLPRCSTYCAIDFI